MALCERALLLVLDNFEQVVPAGPALAAILSRCPHLKVLITSRTVLHLRGEREFAVAPLELPDLAHLPPPADLARYAAVALFVAQAQAIQATFALTPALAPAVAEICVRLDGLPLAIELAAARLRIFSPPQLLVRLAAHRLAILTGGAHDLPERQQTMRRAIAWSYNLLTEQEQRLFRRLAVFAGGCTLEAITSVCVAPEAAAPVDRDALDVLSTLVAHSLVQLQIEGQEGDSESRFAMLHVVREYGLEQLEIYQERGVVPHPRSLLPRADGAGGAGAPRASSRSVVVTARA